MTDTLCERDPVERLADEFAGRCRRGEAPTVAEYAAEHPEYAGQIAALFPAVALMEQLRVRELGRRAAAGRSWSAVPPQQIGDFEIVREMGRGGMGIVYEAEQRSLARRVAVKVLPRHVLLLDNHLKRFRREAQTAARLRHTHIVPVFGVGEQDGWHYYVMPLIRGVGLDEIIRELRRRGCHRRWTAWPGRPGRSVRIAAAGTAPAIVGGRRGRPFRRDLVASSAADRGEIRGGGTGRGPARRAGGLLADRRPHGSPSRRGPGLRPSAGHAASGHQAEQSAGRPGRGGLRGGLRSGPRGRGAGRKPQRRSRRHAAVHGARAIAGHRRRPQRRLRAGADAVRVADAAAGGGRRRPAAERPAGRRRVRRTPQARPGDSPGPGNDRPEMPGPRAGETLCDGGGAGGRPAAVPGGPADPGPPRVRNRTGRAVVPPQPGAGRDVGAGGRAAAGQRGHGLVGRAADPAGVCRERRRRWRGPRPRRGWPWRRWTASTCSWPPIASGLAADSAAGGAACACVGLRSAGDSAAAGPRPARQCTVSQETAALLQGLLGFYERLAEQDPGDANVRRESAVASRRVGDIRQRLGQADRAEAEYAVGRRETHGLERPAHRRRRPAGRTRAGPQRDRQRAFGPAGNRPCLRVAPRGADRPPGGRAGRRNVARVPVRTGPHVVLPGGPPPRRSGGRARRRRRRGRRPGPDASRNQPGLPPGRPSAFSNGWCANSPRPRTTGSCSPCVAARRYWAPRRSGVRRMPEGRQRALQLLEELTAQLSRGGRLSLRVDRHLRLDPRRPVSLAAAGRRRSGSRRAPPQGAGRVAVAGRRTIPRFPTTRGPGR